MPTEIEGMKKRGRVYVVRTLLLLQQSTSSSIYDIFLEVYRCHMRLELSIIIFKFIIFPFQCDLAGTEPAGDIVYALYNKVGESVHAFVRAFIYHRECVSLCLLDIQQSSVYFVCMSVCP